MVWALNTTSTLLGWVALLISYAVARAPSDPTPVSCSIDGLADYSRTMPFCNLAKQARPFGSARSPYDNNCTVGKDGWPTQDQFGLVFITETTGPGGIMMDGIYTLRFIGNATLSNPVSTWTLQNYTHDPATDVTLAYIEVPKAGNGQLWIGFRDAVMKGGVPGGKNISLLQPGCSMDDLHALSPSLLKLVGKFDSLRFMDWTATNGNLEEKWSDRRSLDAPSYVAKTPGSNTSGIPWEACVKLANSAEKDMWINIPGHADDEYIINLATLLKAAVDPTLFIYYEYANEVWNWQFEVATYNLHMANASVLAHGDPNHLNYDNCSNEGFWAWRRTAYMCKHVADLFKTVFGDENVGRGKRVRPLLAGQVSSPFVVENGLEYIDAVFGPPRDFLHGIAGAPYFGIGPSDTNPQLTVDEIYAGFDSSIHNMSIAAGFGEENFMAAHVAMAYHYGLEMRAYEGGPDTSGPNLGKPYLAIKGQANIDPRIEGRIATYLTNWYSWGDAMGPLNYFVAGATNLIDQYGSYGILEDMRVQVRLNPPRDPRLYTKLTSHQCHTVNRQ